MVRLNYHVHKCGRKSGDTLKEFIARFDVPSFAYLKIVRGDYHSTKSQILAMTLIINENMGENVRKHNRYAHQRGEELF